MPKVETGNENVYDKDENIVKTIEIYVKEKETADGKTTFNTYHSKKTDGKFIQTKFTKEAGYPKATTRCTIDVNIKDMNISKSGIYPVLWIAKFSNEKAVVKDTNELKEMF